MEVINLREEVFSLRETVIQDIQDKYSNNELYLSYSSLSAFRKSPKHFIDYKMKVDSDTDSMLTGQALHCLVLEPHKFNNTFAISPNVDRRTKAGKEEFEQFIQTANGKTVLSNAIYETAVDMAVAVLLNDESKKLLDNVVEVEKKVFFEKYGLKFVSILDGLGENFIVDIKMMPDSDPKKVQREIIGRSIWLQGGMYQLAIQENKDFYIIAVDKSGNVSVHLIMQGFLDYGQSEVKRLSADFEDCLATNSWSKSYNYRSHNGIYPIDKPQFNI